MFHLTCMFKFYLFLLNQLDCLKKYALFVAQIQSIWTFVGVWSQHARHVFYIDLVYL